jgi:hypothetical protein
MQFAADLNVTNLWTKDVRLLSARLRYRVGLRRREIEGQVMVKDTHSPFSGSYPIESGATGSVRAHIVFPEPKPQIQTSAAAATAALDVAVVR